MERGTTTAIKVGRSEEGREKVTRIGERQGRGNKEKSFQSLLSLFQTSVEGRKEKQKIKATIGGREGGKGRIGRGRGKRRRRKRRRKKRSLDLFFPPLSR